MESTQEQEYLIEFKELVLKDVAVPVSAMKTLISVIKRSTSTTWMQLEHELRTVIKLLKKCNANDLLGRTKISLGSGCDLFMKYVTRSFLEFTVTSLLPFS
jgi:translation initiation factor 2B subunit (eIF-2B alpha/beta/delta family)